MNIQNPSIRASLGLTLQAPPQSRSPDELAKMKAEKTAQLKLDINIRPNAGDLGTTTPAAPDSSTPAAFAPDEPLTVEGLLAEWGEKGSRYDLNGSGLVDFDDLTELLAQQAQQAPPPRETGDETTPPATRLTLDAVAPTPEPNEPSNPAAPPTTDIADVAAPTLHDVAPTPAPEPAAPALTLEGLFAAWGKADSDYDLDGSGVVDFNDMTELLAHLAEQSDPAGTPASETSNSVPQLTVEGLMEAWGQRGSMYDLDGNGTVDFDDLTALLAQINVPSESQQVAESNPNQIGNTIEGERSEKRAAALGASLLAKLQEHGFEKQPPINIRELIASLKLTESEQKGVLSRIAAHYPNGLGVNVVG